MGTMTPWGLSDGKVKFACGINSYSTPSHGGYKVSAKKNLLIPDYMRHDDGWYEEDCDWSIVVTSFPGYFSEKTRESAKETLKHWHWRAYEKFYNVVLAKGESHAKDDEVFKNN